MWPASVVRLSICLTCLATHISTSALGQVQEDWQVLKIFVPEEEVGSLVPNDYNPVELEDLAEALAREATRRTQLQSNPHIAEAIYVVRCSTESLVSDQSRWSVKSPKNNASLKLDEISVALRNSGSTPVDDKPLGPSLRYSTDGTATLSRITGDTNYWFGMSSVPTANAGGRSTYDMRLPTATMARMLVSYPESMQISSPDVVVTQVSNPRDFLPDSWPSLATTDGQRWCIVHLSGKSKFRLITEVTERKDALAFQHFVRRTSLVYSASTKGLAVSADFEVERLSATTALQLLLDRSLRVRSVTVNGTFVDYRLLDSVGDKITFDVPITNLSAGSARLRIEALTDVRFPFDDVLPTIEIVNSFSWEGKTSLLAEDALVSERLMLASRSEVSKPRLETTTIGKRWVAEWIGVPPYLRANIGRIAPSCAVESFTRLTIQEDWVSATANLRIACSALDSNELRMRIGKGWFIDDITIEKSDLPVTAQLPDGEAGDVVLTWDRLNSEMSINMQLVAHLPKVTIGEPFSLEAPRVVSVIEGSQKDNYAIEQTGRYKIDANPILQRLELAEEELPPWQSQLLSRSGVTQLFQGLGDSIPPIVMHRSVGTYNAKVITVARQANGHLHAYYSVEIQPTSGAIDSVTCILSLPTDVDVPNWRITKELDGEQIPVARTVVHASREGPIANSRSQVRFEFQLPDASAGKFILQSELQLPSRGVSMNLPLVTMPVATETWMILPRDLEMSSSSLGIIALPVSVCCESSDFSRMIDNDLDSMVGYRYDPSLVSHVDLRPTMNPSSRRGWIWSDATQHRLYNNGDETHQTDLQIFAPENISLVATLPVGWYLNRVLIDGSVSVAAQQLDSERVQIQIPRGKQVHLSLHASSHRRALGWYTRALFPKPHFSLTSLKSSELLWLQPGRLSISEIFCDEPIPIAGRLSPNSWWQWLNPSPRFITNSDFDAEGWRSVPLRIMSPDSGSLRNKPSNSSAGLTAGDQADAGPFDPGPFDPATAGAVSAIELFDRSSMSALCIALLLTGSSLSFWILGDRVALWWISLTLGIVGALVVPPSFVGLAHLFLLCVVGGAISRLVRIVTCARVGSNGYSRRGSTLVRTGSNATLALLLSCIGGVCSAQDSSLDKTKTKFPQTFGVLIPLNEEGELSAKHVYAPRKLMNLLNNSDSQENEEQTPQILAAKYMLKISGGTSLTASYVQEFTAEFDLQFNSTDFALRLPFKSNQLQLLRGSVSGQGVYIGPRLQQTAEAISYRPPETGRVRLRLQLIPTANANADRTGIEVDIPRIASSTLEVIADDTLDVNIKSVGLVRRLTASSWSAELGPTDAIRVDWPTRSQRTPMPNQAVSLSDTWVHFSEGQIVADCQIRINGARSLPKQLHVLLDAGWEPVGSEWNDFKLISNELSPVGNRRIYLVNRESLSDRVVLRVSIAPRNGETVSTLAVPFLSLSESLPSGRTLAVSFSGKSRWKLIGTEFWNRMNATSSDLEWDVGKPPLTDLWRVPNSAVSGSLQRVSSEVASVDEVCELSLLSTKTTLDYRATWSQPTDTQVLKLEIPSDAETGNVRVNGTETDFRVSEREQRKFLLVNVSRTPTELRVLEVEMQMPSPRESAHLPRIVLQDTEVSRSTYQVNCGAELSCTLHETDSIESSSQLEFTRPTADPIDMLSTLTSPVGVVELANSYRESSELPMRFKVQRRLPAVITENAMALTRTDQGWRASVEIVLPEEKSSEFVFLDIPTTIRDSIESTGSPFRVASSGAAGRSTLCLLPQAPGNGVSRIKFAFRLPALGSSQSLPIPDIYILGKEPRRPVLALPKIVDDQPVRWLRAGRKLPDDWLSKSKLELSDDFTFFETSDSQQLATWRQSDEESYPAEVLFAWAIIAEDNDGSLSGAINYWIDPNNHLDVSLQLPEDSQLIGIQSGSSGAVWYPNKNGSVRILMQPNYLPVQVRVLLRWPKRTMASRADKSFELKLPVIDAAGMKQMSIAVLSDAIIDSVESMQNQGAATQFEVQDGIAATQVDAMLADVWSKLLLKSLPVVADLNVDEFSGWMRNWNPEGTGLQPFQVFSGRSSPSDANRDTVASFWSWFIEQTTAAKFELRSAVAENSPMDSISTRDAVMLASEFVKPNVANLSSLPRAGAVWYLVDCAKQERPTAMKLKFKSERREQTIAPKAVVAIMFCMGSGLLFSLVRRLRARTNEILSAHAWLYWAFLAVLAWLIFPVAWPSVVIGMCSVGMATGQLMNSRRRQLALRR